MQLWCHLVLQKQSRCIFSHSLSYPFQFHRFFYFCSFFWGRGWSEGTGPQGEGTELDAVINSRSVAPATTALCGSPFRLAYSLLVNGDPQQWMAWWTHVLDVSSWNIQDNGHPD
jgi:hypothetical protein